MGDWIYRCLLRLYPREVRAAFGDEMLAFFRSRRSASAAHGIVSLARFWVRTLADLGLSAAREWRPRIETALAPAAIARSIGRDGREAWTGVLRRPSSSLAIVMLLALAIGAATSVFSVVNAVLIRPLPFGDPDRLVTVWETRSERQIDRNVVSGHEFPIWAERNRVFEKMAAITYASLTLTGGGEPLSVAGARVTSGFCEVMGVRPLAGRGFTPEEDVPGRGQVALISHRLWFDRFGGDPAIVGRAVHLNDRPFTVIGVMPAGFRFPAIQVGPQAGAQTDVWTPIAEPIQQYRGRHYLYVVARLRAGVPVERAHDDMTRVAADLTRELPNLNKDHGARVVPLHRDLVRDSRASLLLLFGAVAGLVAIGCCNVAGLLVARGATRRPEMAMRLALGASRWDLLRQLLAEGLILSGAASLAGIALSYWFAAAAPAVVPADVIALDGVPIDSRVLGFAISAGLVTGLLFGIAPAVQFRRVDLSSTLKAGPRGILAAGRGRRGLLVGQIALTMLLVFAATLVARALAALQAIDPGFTTSGVLAVDLGLPGARYGALPSQRQFFSELLDRVRTLPGVVSASASNMLPLGGAYSGVAVSIEGRPAPAPDEDVSARLRVVSTDYFSTMGIPVRSGRVFTPADARVAVPVIRWFPQQPQPRGADLPQPRPSAVINEQMARTFWSGTDPIGREFRVLFSAPIVVIGVVADARNESIQSGPKPEFFLHDLQEPQSSMSVLVRVHGDPASIAPGVRSAIHTLDPQLAIASMRPLDAVRARALGRPRFASWLLGVFGVLALLLMAAGVYGLLAFTTAQQLPEIGVRVALGADRSTIVRMVLGRAMGWTLSGLAVGTLGAMALGAVLSSAFFGVDPVDPVSWAIVTIVVIAVGLLACWRPARIAARVDPAVVLRQG